MSGPALSPASQQIVVRATLRSNTDAAVSMELARKRPLLAGFVAVELPAQPMYTNDPGTERARHEEYRELVSQCRTEANVWNAEARRWHAGRSAMVATHVRKDIIGCTSRDDVDQPTTHLQRRERALMGETDMVIGDTGLATTAMLTDVVERQGQIESAVAHAQAQAKWRLGQEESRDALASLHAEQRSAFIVRWQAQLSVVPSQASCIPQPASTLSQSKGAVLHVSDMHGEFGDRQQQLGQSRGPSLSYG